jgi:hypothetical protein
MNMENKILERLRLLIAHEKSARTIGSIHEAEAFASKIQAMLDEHKLGMDEVQWTERETQEPIAWQHVNKEDPDFRYSDRRREWQTSLAAAIAKCNGCRAILQNGGGNQLFFVGRTSDRELCKVLFLYLMDLAYDLNELCVKQDKGEQKFKYVNQLQPWQDYDINAFNTWMRRYKSAWFEGFSDAVCERFHDQYRKMRKQAEDAASNGCTALIHINNDLIEVNKSLRGKVNQTSSGRRGDTRIRDGYERGRRSGESVNLSPKTFSGTTGRTSRLLA